MKQVVHKVMVGLSLVCTVSLFGACSHTLKEQSGPLEKETIRSVITDNLSSIQDCYREGLYRDKSLAGDLKTQFLIAGTGEVESVRILRGSLEDLQVRNCVQQTIMKWKFPRTKERESTRVTYPFRFKALKG